MRKAGTEVDTSWNATWTWPRRCPNKVPTTLDLRGGGGERVGDGDGEEVKREVSLERESLGLGKMHEMLRGGSKWSWKERE